MFYVLGFFIIDIAVGYDYILGVMGVFIAVLNGVDFLCYVIFVEYLRFFFLEDVKEGIVVFKIAVYSVNIVKGFKKLFEKDIEMLVVRRDFDWEKMISFLVDFEKVREYRISFIFDICLMCGRFCVVKNLRDEVIL